MTSYKMRAFTVLTALAAAALTIGAAACHRGPKAGAIGPDGYRHATYPYGVLHDLGAYLLPPDWVLDNYHRTSSGKIAPKEGPRYLTWYHLDTDNDGQFDDKVEASRFDLYFLHQKTGSSIFVRTIPQSYRTANLNLDVLAKSYANGLAGGQFEVVEFGPEDRKLLNVVETRRYVSAIESEGPVTLAGVPAYQATIVLRNADQPEPPETKISVVFARPGFAFGHRSKGKLLQYPVLLMAVYEALPNRFDENLEDFKRFLSAVTVGSARGYSEPPPSPAAPAPTPELAPSDADDAGAPPSDPAAPAADAGAGPAPSPAADAGAPVMQ